VSEYKLGKGPLSLLYLLLALQSLVMVLGIGSEKRARRPLDTRPDHGHQEGRLIVPVFFSVDDFRKFVYCIETASSEKVPLHH
jgi:hypothetical protein